MNNWTEALGEEKQQAYFQQILQQVHQERMNGVTVFHRKKKYLVPLH
ncbi:uracil-DNA glycosylase [Actinobacillus equuli]|nr:uracil-DNA glycosylase [Actinobacillus equuli]